MPRPKGSKNRRTIAKEKQIEAFHGIDPREHISGVLANKIKGPSAMRSVCCPECGHQVQAPDDEAADKYRAAVDLMPYTYARLSATKVDADVNLKASGDQVTEAHRLVTVALAVPVETNGAANGHANGSGNGATNGGLKAKQ